MDKHNFDGRVAVVTGAGRGIGRGYALLLGRLGAKVVVNDLGVTREGAGADAEPAQTVAAEITAAGGTAIANTSDVSTVDGGEAVIAAAVNEFGRIDVLVNNAGNVIWGGLPDVNVDVLDSHLSVHVKGSFNTTRAAWPHLLKQNFGRIVMTTSVGMFGLPDNLSYAVAKAAFIGMAKSMTVSAGDHNIKINCIAPNAWTRMATHPNEERAGIERPAPQQMEPELVAPMVAFLSHEACPVSGEVYVAGGGRFGRLFVGATEGYLSPDPYAFSVDDVAEHWAQINDERGYYVPTSLMDWSSHYSSHLRGDRRAGGLAEAGRIGME